MDIQRKDGKRYFLTLRIARSLYVLHPVAPLLYLALFVVLIFMLNHPLLLTTCFLFATLQAFYFVGFAATIKRLKIYVLFGLIIVVLTPIFNHRGTHLLFYLFDKPFTLEALAYGFYTMLLLMSILTAFITFNSIVTPDKFLYLFSRAAPQTAFIVNMTLRFSSVLRRKASDYMDVQKTRGNTAVQRTLIEKIKNAGRLFGDFSLWALEDGLAVSETLRAKAYGHRKRTHYATYALTHTDVAFVIISILIFAAINYLRLINIHTYDYFKNLTDLSLHANLWLVYALVVIYLLIPFCMDVFQKLQRSFQCRI